MKLNSIVQSRSNAGRLMSTVIIALVLTLALGDRDMTSRLGPRGDVISQHSKSNRPHRHSDDPMADVRDAELTLTEKARMRNALEQDARQWAIATNEGNARRWRAKPIGERKGWLKWH
jgi:hypothetical protein